LKLLFDQNISPKVVKQLASVFEDSQQVRHVGLEDSSDFKIFDFAKKHDFVIVTFDSDFIDLNILKGAPPKIIWIRSQNQTTKNVAKILKDNIIEILEFFDSREIEIMELQG
jgi:predicted nuclease of predicted toxin-antitoxin system